jgi:ribonuclease P protein component
MIGRLERSIDFERVLRWPSLAKSAHFAIHHLHDAPSPAQQRPKRELSTGGACVVARSVDDSRRARTEATASTAAPPGQWLGAVVPKRHARRAVTRNLLKRQIRATARQYASSLAFGLWVVRLRAPFDRTLFFSAASDALKRAARTELEAALARCVERAAPGAVRAGG